ncbi:hypothetical protein D9758_016025 [Tetrapyrgos nigripes]|uniref:Cytochrome P450 n=1 Tax=Tetrapyrgos nigripes TaxID=182062 RepID=A0A8H5FNK6_9AGAR|nr:hypothetical protein D9758_016025 [Tetrapyrgos nigripes]
MKLQIYPTFVQLFARLSVEPIETSFRRVKKFLAPNPFIFLPFNAGPRICLGQQHRSPKFAYNEMSLMIIRLVQNFSSFTYDEEACPPEWRARPQWREAIKADANTCGQGYRKATDRIYPKMTLTMSIAGGMWIKATEADNVGELV